MKKDVLILCFAILLVVIVVCIEYGIATSDLPDWVKFMLLK